MSFHLQLRIRGTATPGPGAPPPGLIAFYWHFARQTKGWYALISAVPQRLLTTVLVDHAFDGGRASRAEIVRLEREHDAIHFGAEHTFRIAVRAFEETDPAPSSVLCEQRCLPPA